MKNINKDIVFNKPYITGDEPLYISGAVHKGKLSGNGEYTQLCQHFFEKRYKLKKVLLTTSGTDALEMAALLLDIQPGDEVIMPSFTYVSTANAFALRGAKILFADVEPGIPNISYEEIVKLTTKKTKAIVLVHYAGFACDMERIMTFARSEGITVVEDAALAIESKYKDEYLGSFGDLAAFSFHETKNIISGEGGMLAINNDQFIERAEIIWEKGTNRAAFSRGEVNKYVWKDLGSSYLPSELTAAFLYAQLKHIYDIQSKRLKIWFSYFNRLKKLEQSGFISLPDLSGTNEPNASVFYIQVNRIEDRDKLIHFLREHRILAVFHYLPLHSSDYFSSKHDGRKLSNTDLISGSIIRLPLYVELEEEEIDFVAATIGDYFEMIP